MAYFICKKQKNKTNTKLNSVLYLNETNTWNWNQWIIICSYKSDLLLEKVFCTVNSVNWHYNCLWTNIACVPDFNLKVQFQLFNHISQSLVADVNDWDAVEPSKKLVSGPLSMAADCYVYCSQKIYLHMDIAKQFTILWWQL